MDTKTRMLRKVKRTMTLFSNLGRMTKIYFSKGLVQRADLMAWAHTCHEDMPSYQQHTIVLHCLSLFSFSTALRARLSNASFIPVIFLRSAFTAAFSVIFSG